MSISLVTKFLPIVDEIFFTESKTSLVSNQDFTWEGAHSVKVYKVSTAPMGDYARNGALPEGQWSRYGKVQGLNATTQEMTLAKDRAFTFEIDKLDEDETAQQLAASTALARQMREVVIPEVDAYVYAQMCAKAGKVETALELTAANIYDELLAASTALDDALVPETGRVVIVTPATYELMKKSGEIVLQSDVGSDMRIKGVIGMLDGASVIKVPAARLPEGFGFLMCHASAVVAPTKLADYSIHQNPPGISGSLVEGRIVYDAFVLDNKADALYYQPIA